jgi:hypothetical protein
VAIYGIDGKEMLHLEDGQAFGESFLLEPVEEVENQQPQHSIIYVAVEDTTIFFLGAFFIHFSFLHFLRY